MRDSTSKPCQGNLRSDCRPRPQPQCVLCFLLPFLAKKHEWSEKTNYILKLGVYVTPLWYIISMLRRQCFPMFAYSKIAKLTETPQNN